jgi:Tfp pilus assembly protein PilV
VNLLLCLFASLTTAGLIRRCRIKYKYFNNQAGWIFIDSLTATLIIAVGVLAMLVAYTQTTRATSYSDKATQATYLAQQGLESLKKTYDGSTTAPVLPATATDSSGVFTISYKVDTATQLLSPVSNLNVVPVTITVSWTDQSSKNVTSISVSAYYYYFSG